MRARVAAALLLLGCSRTPIGAGLTELDAIARTAELDMRWGHDPESHLIVVANESGEPGLTLVDSRGLAGPRPLAVQARWPHRPVLSPGGRYLAFEDRPPNDEPVSLFVIDMATGAQRTVFTPDPGGGHADRYREFCAFSPDGRQLLYELRGSGTERRVEDRLLVLDLAAETTRTLLRSPTLVRGPVWKRDGHIYFATVDALARVPMDGGDVEIMGRVAGGAAEADTGEAVAVDEAGTAAFTVEIGGCTRIALVDLPPRSANVRLLACGFRPSFRAGISEDLLAIASPGNGSRAPRIDRVDDLVSRSLGLEPGVTTELSSEDDGTIIALAATPRTPRAIWRYAPDGTAPQTVYVPSPAIEGGEMELVRTLSPDGTVVPSLLFRAACRDPSPRPLVLFLHGGPAGHHDTTPRWAREIQYLTHIGVAVLAINVRGSTGYGTAYRDLIAPVSAQVADVRAALAEAKAALGVDATRLFIFSVSSARELTAALVVGDPGAFGGVVSWVSSPEPLRAVSGPLAGLPPILWLSGRDEPGAADHEHLADELRARGLRLRHVAVNDDHTIRSADAAAVALDEVHRFLGTSCAP